MEPVTESKNPDETSAGSLGLGAALAVAYDLPVDPNYTQSGYTQTEQSFPIASVAPQTGFFLIAKNGYYPQVPQTASQPIRLQTTGDPEWTLSGYPAQLPPPVPAHQQPQQPMTAYLNPIPVSSPGPTRILGNGSYFFHPLPQQQQQSHQLIETTGYLEAAGATSESTMSTDSVLSIRSDSVPNYQPAEAGYILNRGVQPSSLASHVTPTTTAAPSATSRRHDDHRQAAVPSTGSDDGLYELSEEDVKEIDDMLTSNPQVTSSRHWKYYVETNEWTRATCALMACLFSRDQMANSTVLGRGGSQRERLPTNLVAYVVTKMRRRFNKSAAAVRARMAQKCKDERRFGRVLPSGVIATNTDRSQPAAATSARNSTVNRRRSAATGGNGSSPPSAKSQRLSGPTEEGYLVSGGLIQPPPAHTSSMNPTVVVNDPPVILASAPEMTS